MSDLVDLADLVLSECQEPSAPTSSLWSYRRPIVLHPSPVQGRPAPSELSPPPFPRYGFGLAATENGDVYFFGNHGNHDSSLLYHYSAKDNTAAVLQCDGYDDPGPRSRHAMTIIGSNVLALHGGRVSKNGGAADPSLFLFNLVSRKWSKIPVAGSAPGSRQGHSMVAVGTTIFMFGGWSSQGQGHFDELWAFDLKTMYTQPRWELVTPSSTEKPSARSYFVLAPYQNQLILFGGYRGLHLADTWAFNTNTEKWSQFQCVGDVPSPRSCTAGVMLDDIMYVIGGYHEKELNDVFTLKISERRWLRVKGIEKVESRYEHAAARIGTKILVFGGRPDTLGDKKDMVAVLDTEHIDNRGLHTQERLMELDTDPDIKALSKVNRGSPRRLADLEEAEGKLEKRLAEFDRGKGELEKRFAELEGGKKELEERLAELEGGRGTLEKRFTELERGNEGRMRESSELKVGLAVLEGSEAELEKRLAEFDKDKEKLEKRFAEFEGGEGELEKKLTELERQMMRENSELERRLAELEKKSRELKHRDFIAAILDSLSKANSLTSLQGMDAQAMVDFLASVLESREHLRSDADRRHALHLLRKIARFAQVFPKQTELCGVQCNIADPINDIGSYGAIYKGVFEGHAVCVKAVRIDAGPSSGSAAKKIIRAQAGELALLAHVSHSNVIPLSGAYLSVERNPRICIVSPWMENGDLTDYLTKFPDTSRIPLMSDVAAGLQFLHDMGIVHADIKARNVLVSRSQRAMLADFGVSVVLNTTSSIAGVSGTTYWMAPELLISEEVPPPTPQSDIPPRTKAMTGQTPFLEHYKYPGQLIGAFVRGYVTPLRPKRNCLPTITDGGPLMTLAERCWNYEPSERPTAAEALRFLTELNVEDSRPSMGEELAMFEALKSKRTQVKIDYQYLLSVVRKVSFGCFVIGI
ncbi:Tip elongation aberrant protein 1 [Leucoagaricus sp. SymC.cos]|nr:Tip elongation aberrant protein 1 [Leucoagaricus sp. SymC.cos]